MDLKTLIKQWLAECSVDNAIVLVGDRCYRANQALGVVSGLEDGDLDRFPMLPCPEWLRREIVKDNEPLAAWLEHCGVPKAIIEVDKRFYLVDPSGIQPVTDDIKSVVGSRVFGLEDLRTLEAPLWLAGLIREKARLNALVAERHQKNLLFFERLFRDHAIIRNTYELYGRQQGEELYLDIVVALAAENQRLQKLALDSMSRMPPPVIRIDYFAGGFAQEPLSVQRLASETPHWLQNRGENE